MFTILIDSSVWLDLVKDHRQLPLLTALEQLVERGAVSLVVPDVVKSEYSRNRERVLGESARQYSSALSRARTILRDLGHGKVNERARDHLLDVGQQLRGTRDALEPLAQRVEKLLDEGEEVRTSQDVLARAAQRALDRVAPFHRPRNSIADAIIIDVYASLVACRPQRGRRYAFVTHNTKDFSHPHGDDRAPHPDLAGLFTRVRSLYMISLAEVLRRVDPQVITEAMFQLEEFPTPRSLEEIQGAEVAFFEKVWYGRHQVLVERVESGQEVVGESSEGFDSAVVHDRIWKGARRAASRIQAKHGLENLGPWTDFEWGMINGKLSALRWVLGDEWDFLDT